MMNLPDHPDIRQAESTGYPAGFRPVRACPQCGGDMSPTRYVLDGLEVCEDCFGDWLRERIGSDLREAADRMGIRYIQEI